MSNANRPKNKLDFPWDEKAKKLGLRGCNISLAEHIFRIKTAKGCGQTEQILVALAAAYKDGKRVGCNGNG